MEPTRARLEAALAALQPLLTFAGPADHALKRFFREHSELGQHDRAFVAELAFAVLRHLRLLETLATQRSVRRLVLAALTVTFGISVRELKPFLRGDEEHWLTEVRGRAHAELPPAVRLSLPDWLYELLLQQYGSDETERLGRALLQQAPLDLRVNTLLSSRDDVLAQLIEEGMDAAATPYSPVGIRLGTKPSLQKHPLFLGGTIEVQDQGSQLLSYLVA